VTSETSEISELDESVVEAHGAPAADSPSSHPAPVISHGRDAARALVGALLVYVSCDSVATAIAVAPFVPLLVALRLTRSDTGAREFLGMTLVAGLVAAASATYDDAALLPAALVASAAFTAGLGMVHALALRPDPVEPMSERLGAVDPAPAWPEPTLGGGFNAVVAAWVLAVALIVAALTPTTADLRNQGVAAARGVYASYTSSCAKGGTFEDQDVFCERILDQRDSVVDLVRDHPSEIIGAALALLVLAGAGTTHLLLGWRARAQALTARRGWRLREFETHWAMAYVMAAGLGLVLAGDARSGGIATLVVGTGAAAIVLGGALIATHGLGTLTAMLARRGSSIAYRVFLVVIALLAPPIAGGTLLIVGMLDLGLRLRRRDSGSLPRRDSGS